MNMAYKKWVIFIILAALSLAIWYKLSYPQFSFVNLKIDKKQATNIAESFLRSRGIESSSYLRAVIFGVDSEADRYLQKTIGSEEEKFIKTHDYDLFMWVVRFFRENEKEEYMIKISSKTGKIIGFNHLIEDTEKRDVIAKEKALKKAESFLKEIYNIDFKNYDFHSEKIKKYDNRIDYNFSWEKRGIYIPWEEIKDSGGAKLIISVIVSGNEIKAFHKEKLDIPEKFKRYIEKQTILGGFVASFFVLIFLVLIAWSIFLVTNRRGELVMQRTWRTFVIFAIFIFCIKILDSANSFQNILFQYKTSSSLSHFFGLSFMGFFISYIFISLSIVMPGVAGESLRYEVYPSKKQNSLFHFVSSTFLSRSVSKSVIFGYLIFFILLGLQSVLFYFGQKHLGVWIEKIKFTSLSSAYIPFLGAFIIGCSASLIEETVFRIFAISWAKKYFKNTILALIVASVIWGFCHVGYPVYPVWFRGIEVSIIGLFYGFIFLKYGIIPLFISHYLFDVFWGVAAYILGDASAYLFYGSIFILIIPLIFALIAYLANKEETEKDIATALNTHQRYNLNILVTFIMERKKDRIPDGHLKRELISHGWDRSLVELAFQHIHLDNKI